MTARAQTENQTYYLNIRDKIEQMQNRTQNSRHPSTKTKRTSKDIKGEDDKSSYRQSNLRGWINQCQKQQNTQSNT